MKWILLLGLVLLIPMVHAECSLTIESKFASGFFNEIEALNSQLQTCPVPLASYIAKLYKNGNFLVNVEMNDDTTKSFMITLKDGTIAGLSTNTNNPTYTVKIEEDDFNAILQSSNKMGTFAYLYKKGNIKIKANNIIQGIKFFFIKPFINAGLGKIQNPNIWTPPQQSLDVGEYPGYRVCEFYQTNKKLVTCAAYKAGDTFCVTTMGHPEAKAVKCEENGLVICTLPCSPKQYAAPLKTCPFDNGRPRGSQAPPLEFCEATAQPQQPEKKLPGALCQHGGECTTGNCVGEGMGPPWTYRCSCDPFKYVANC
ncbi:hypothetical protein C4573_02410 [Candidatus Woesearchaeota archaeon]|nr:MAG: hypothetical protein C4573_02410 [Candidatus Woesearchaeota archaeon]